MTRFSCSIFAFEVHSLTGVCPQDGLDSMTQANDTTDPDRRSLAQRLVRYTELRPCTTAFIDTRTPGSAEKENFTIIGPGVSEHPDQHVHISIPHGFNIGGARQPPDCVNSQHSHETAEVFVVHSGRWAFQTGVGGDDAKVILEPGDTISIPTETYRGFTNVGKDSGFLFAVLGGDNPGHVTWAPYVFDAAKKHGLILLDNGSLVDTTKGESIPEGRHPMPATTVEQTRKFRVMSSADLRACVVSTQELQTAVKASVFSGVEETPIIGQMSAEGSMAAGKLNWPHGFHLRRMTVAAGATTPYHQRDSEEVLFLHEGALEVDCLGDSITLASGDTFTTPIGVRRRFRNPTQKPALVYVVRGSDTPGAPVPD